MRNDLSHFGFLKLFVTSLSKREQQRQTIIAVSFIAAPFLWGIKQRNIGDLFMIKRDNPNVFPTPNKTLTGLEREHNWTKFKIFKTTTSQSQDWDNNLMPFPASSKLEEPAPDKNWPRLVKLAVASTNSFQNGVTNFKIAWWFQSQKSCSSTNWNKPDKTTKTSHLSTGEWHFVLRGYPGTPLFHP